MKRLIAAIAMLGIVSCAFAADTLPLMGVGRGAGYTGPGDVVSGAVAFWGFRCYNAAYAGNVADIWDGSTGSTTETLLTCSAGGTVNQTVNSLATTCASSCRVKTLYDQTGNGVHFQQATNANRPTVTVSGLNGHPVLNCISANSTHMTNTATASTHAQPFTVSAMSERTSGTSQVSIFTLSSADNIQFDFGAANTIEIYAGSGFQTASQTDGSPHAFIGLYNGSSSLINVDGVDGGSGTNIGASLYDPSAAGQLNLCATGVPNNFLDGVFAEGGVWPAGFSSGQRTSLSSNMTTYW